MVNFDSDSAVSTPPGDLVKIVILEARQQVTQSMEFYERSDFMKLDAQSRLAEIYGNVRHFWRQIKAMAKRRLKGAKGTIEDPTYDMVNKAIMGANNFEELDEAYDWMNEFIDDMGVTKIDSKRNYEDLDIEEANELEGV